MFPGPVVGNLRAMLLRLESGKGASLPLGVHGSAMLVIQ